MLNRLSKPWLVVVALLVAVALFFFARPLLGVKAKSIAVTRGDLIQTIVSSGRTIAASRLEVGTQLTGVVQSVEVRDGDAVKAGALLARLRDDEQRAAVDQAQAALRETEGRLAQLGTTTGPIADQQVRQAQANFELAQSEHGRVQQLFESGFFSQAKLDEADRNRATAKAQMATAMRQAEAARPKGSDSTLAFTRQAQAAAALEVARSRLAYTRIVTPVAGVVLRRGAEPGDLVLQGTKLFSIAAGETQVLLNVDEKNLGLLRIGQTAWVSPDAYPGQRFEAEVFSIAPSIDVQRGTVEVKLEVPTPPDYVRTDMTVSAEILVAKRASATLINADAVRDVAGAAPWVLVVRDGRAVRTPVKLGARGVGELEVLQGLQPGDAVVPPSEPKVREGTRVRPAN